VAHDLLEARPDLRISGIDVLVSPIARIPVTRFDGTTIPFPDRSFDIVTFIDVLHHTIDPMALLAEGRRVARRAIVIKDHCRDGLFANTTLRFMDWLGNARHGIALPYNYLPESEWRVGFRELALDIASWTGELHLYPWPFSTVFDRKLHFIARLDID
jgi:hypothetical protein